MTTAMLERRITVLEREVRTLRATVVPYIRQTPTKKLPRGLQAALRDVKAGRVSGPFRSASALMKHLEK